MWIDTIIVEKLEDLSVKLQRNIDRTEAFLAAHRTPHRPDNGLRDRKADIKETS